MRDLRVVYPSGQFAFWSSAEECRRLIRSGVAEGIGTRQKLCAARLIDGPARPVAGTKYSHNRETRDNPRGTYTFRHITHLPRSMFTLYA